jgi:hypothetical protein
VAKPVTDPALLAQLEAADTLAAKPVTDPKLLAQLEGGDAKPAPAAGEDVYSRVAGLAKAAGTGIAKGVIGAAGAIPMASDYLHAGANKYLFDPVFDAISGPPKSTRSLGDLVTGAPGRQPININELASPQSIEKGIESVAGEFHKPQNTAEHYAETIGSFLPSVAAGPGSLGTRLVMQAMVPGAASEAAGQLTKGSAAEPWARFGAAVLAPFAAGGGIRAVQKLYEPAIGVNGYGANHLVRAMKADTPGAVEAELERLGPEATMADAGPAMLAKAQGASLNSDEGRSILFNFMKKRDQGTNARVMSDIERALGPPEDPFTATKNIVEHRSMVDSHNYPAVLEAAPPIRTGPMMAELQDAIGNSANGSMEQKALQTLKSMLTREKKVPRIDPYSGRQEFDNRGREIWDSVPVNQDRANVLHKVKTELDGVIEYDKPGLGVPAGALSNQQFAIKKFRHQLNELLEQQAPGYARANAVSAALAKRAEAVKVGTQYLGEGKTTPSPGRFQDEFEQLTAGERIALAKGSRGDVDRVVGTRINDLGALKGELQGEGGWNTAKMKTVHGDDAINELVASVDRNLKFRDVNNKIQEGAQTEIRRAAREQMKPTGLNENALVQHNTTLYGSALSLLKKAAIAIPNKLSGGWQDAGRQGIARVMTAQGPQRDEYVRQIIDALGRHQAAAGVAGTAARRAAVAGLAEVLGRLSGPSDRRFR